MVGGTRHPCAPRAKVPKVSLEHRARHAGARGTGQRNAPLRVEACTARAARAKALAARATKAKAQVLQSGEQDLTAKARAFLRSTSGQVGLLRQEYGPAPLYPRKQRHLLGLQPQGPQVPQPQPLGPHGRQHLQHGQGQHQASPRRLGRETLQEDSTALRPQSACINSLCQLRPRKRQYRHPIGTQRWNQSSHQTSARGGCSSRTS